MTAGEKLEQPLLAGRPNSYVPGTATPTRLVSPGPPAGGGAAAWRGPFAGFVLVDTRLPVDGTLEVGAPPW